MRPGFEACANLQGDDINCQFARSDDQRPIRIVGRLRADMLDPTAPVRAEEVEPQGVGVRVDL